MFQTSIDTGEVPQDWRDANIVSLFKKNERHLASNYRPVSLTSITLRYWSNHFWHVIDVGQKQ
jgi:hypothetical protein